MSFSAPGWLLILALTPLALAAYLAAQRRSRRYAVRFTALDTLRAAAEGGGSMWLRHLPAALVIAAIAALAVALARPRETYRVAIDQASIMLVTDHSGSMAADDVQPSRLAATETAANQFIDRVPAGVKLGAITFSTTADTVQGPVTSHAAARQVIDAQRAGGSTATGDALALALELLHGATRHHPPSAVILLSDGSANAGVDPVAVARQAAQERIPIFTVALGTPAGQVNAGPFQTPVAVPPDPQLMAQIARSSGGRSFNAQSAGELSSIYSHLGSQLGSLTRHREITSRFAAAALVLLVAAAGLSARIAGRFP